MIDLSLTHYVAGRPLLTMWMTSMTSTCAMSLAWTEGTLRTTVSTVVSISSTQVAMGESGITYSFLRLTSLSPTTIPLPPSLPPSFSLKPLDIEFMKQLHNLVNIVPVIGKADTLTAAELKKFKVKVRNMEYNVFISFYQMFGNSGAFAP